MYLTGCTSAKRRYSSHGLIFFCSV